MIIDIHIQYPFTQCMSGVTTHLKLLDSCYICMLILPCSMFFPPFLSLIETCFCIIYCHFGRYDSNIYLSSCGCRTLSLSWFTSQYPFYSNKVVGLYGRCGLGSNAYCIHDADRHRSSAENIIFVFHKFKFKWIEGNF